VTLSDYIFGLKSIKFVILDSNNSYDQAIIFFITFYNFSCMLYKIDGCSTLFIRILISSFVFLLLGIHQTFESLFIHSSTSGK